MRGQILFPFKTMVQSWWMRGVVILIRRAAEVKNLIAHGQELFLLENEILRRFVL